MTYERPFVKYDLNSSLITNEIVKSTSILTGITLRGGALTCCAILVKGLRQLTKSFVSNEENSIIFVKNEENSRTFVGNEEILPDFLSVAPWIFRSSSSTPA